MDENSKTSGEKRSDLASTALPGRKLVTSKTPRMLKPFEITLLRQDLKAVLADRRPTETALDLNGNEWKRSRARSRYERLWKDTGE